MAVPGQLNPKSIAALSTGAIPAFPFIIREVTGDSRQVTLRGRSLPYRRVVFPSEQRVNIKYFPGNPTAQAQVLGPKWGNTTIQGRWSDIFLADDANAATLHNFPAVGGAGIPGASVVGGPTFLSGGSIPGNIGKAQRARTLRDAFYLIQRGGQLLRVEWGSIVRYGFMTQFTPDHEREQDIFWEMEFEFLGDTNAPTRPKLKIVLDPAGLLAKIIAALQKFLDQANAALAKSLGAIQNVTSKITKIGSLVAGLIQMFQGFVQLAFVPADLLGTMKQALTSILLAIKDLLDTLRAIPAAYQAHKNGADASEVNLGEEIARTLIFQARLLGADMTAVLEKLGQLESPDILGFVLLRSDQTLRDVAIQFYGKADGWKRIADFNGLGTSTPPAGTLVKVPR